jgi:hypothetical protein
VFIDEPLRAYAEHVLNSRIPGYAFHLGALDFHPLGLSLDVTDITIRQIEHPDPPVAEVERWHASIHWRELLTGHLVSDQWLDRPVIHFTRPQVKDGTTDQQAWQDAVFAIYPLRINEFRINQGTLTYRENATSKPLQIHELTLKATNIRNVRSKPNEYPSEVHVEARIFDEGHFRLDGHADFLAEPSIAFNADVDMKDMPLADLLPLTAQRQIHLTQGILTAVGHVDYAPTVQKIQLKDLLVRDMKVDFVHATATASKEQETKQTVVRGAKQVANHPTLILRIDRGSIEKSGFGWVNKSTNPPYRVFMEGSDIYLENWSNQLSEGTALVRVRGLLMGNGATVIVGTFRPETHSPDFDLSVRIWRTTIKSMNDLLRAYGGVDVSKGVFSLFSEMHVNNGTVRGYLKPLFKDVAAYDPEQDQDKGLLNQIFEHTIDTLAQVLKNTPRGEVATKMELSGALNQPHASTWEMVLALVQNAFFDAILPGLEGEKTKS